MRKILKRLGVGILALSLVFTPNISALASTTNRGGSDNSSVQSGSASDIPPGCGSSAGFCFRIMLYDVPEDNDGNKDKLWKEEPKESGKYQMKSNANKLLDVEARDSAIYVGLEHDDNGVSTKTKKTYRVFDSQHKTDKGSKFNPNYISIKPKRIISDDAFKKIPGMSGSGFDSKNLSKEGLKWSEFFNGKDDSADGLNKFSAQTANVDKTNTLITYFEKHFGIKKNKYGGENTMVVVEPMIIWKFKGYRLLVSFQNAINLTGKAHDRLMKFYPKQDMYLKTDGGRYTVGAQGKVKARQRIAQLGGVKQSQIVKKNDCNATKFYSSGSGYVCFGTDKIESSHLGGNVAVVCDTDPINGEVKLDSSSVKTYQAINLESGGTLYKYNIDKENFSKVANKNKKKKGRVGVTDEDYVNKHSVMFSGIYQYMPNYSTKGYKRVYNTANVKAKMLEDFNSAEKIKRHITLRWTAKNISCSDAKWKIGKRYTATALKFREKDGYKESSEPIAKYINSHLADARNDGNADVSRGNKDTDKYYGKKLSSVKYIISQMDNAISSSSGSFSKKSGVKKDNTYGLGVEILVKNKQVTDHIVTINVKGSDSVTVSEKSNKHLVMKNLNNKVCYTKKTFGSKDLYAIAVPNYSAKGYSKEVANAIANACKSDTKEGAKANFKAQFDEKADKVKAWIKPSKGKKIGIGAATDDGKTDGHTLYILQYKNSGTTKTEKVSGQLDLKDYELNTVFPDMCASASTVEKPMVVTLNKDLWTYEGLNRCDGANYNSTNEWQSYQKNYTLVITETSASGKNVEKDDKLSGTKMYLANYASPIPSNFGTRAELKKGKELDSRQDHRVTYAFNLSRGMFDDKRTVSTISDQTLGKDFATTVLDLNYGDIPGGSDAESESDTDAETGTGDETGTDSESGIDGESDTDDEDSSGIKEASEKRNSNATVGDMILDTFNFDAKYKVTDSKTKHEEVVNKSHWHYYKHWYQYYTSTENGGYWSSDWYWDKNYKHNYIDFVDHTDELLAFNINGDNSAKAKLELKSIAHKYSTEENETGKNTKVPDSKYLREELQKPKTGSNGMTENLTIGSEKTGYATAYVKNSETVLSFYPEVPMQAMEYSGDTITSSDSVAIKRVLTIGEEKRNAYSSSLYLFTIKRDKTTSSDDDDLSGTTYSDTAVGGSKASKISDMVTLTAGGDFGVAIKETGFSLNLYGYAMDVINSDEDDSMLVAQSGVKDMASGVENTQDVSINYTDIVKDGSNVYSDWGNSTDADSMKDEFKTWVTAMLKPENFKADMEMQLYKGNTDERLRGSSVTNFNTTLGKLSDGDEGDEMTFPLTVRHGEVVKYTIDANGNQTTTLDSNYEKFISQLADDYGLGDGDGTTRFEKAEKLFKASGLYTSIIDAIESDKATANNSLSQKEQSGSTTDPVVKLGNNTHWYDEEVKTIVLRRFAYEGVHFQNITANDKLDLGDAVTSGSTDQKYTGKFGLTISITQKFKGALSAQNIQFGASDLSLYNSNSRGSTLADARNSGGLLVENLHIHNADCTVIDRTTADMDTQ